MNDEKFKEFVDSYQDAEGMNPISAALSLWTIAKSVPVNAIKSALVALLIYFGSLIGCYFIGLPWWMVLIVIFGGLIGLIFLLLTGFVKFISGSVISSVAELLSGLISPLDDMYDLYKENKGGDLTRTQFFKKAIREIIFPRVSDALSLLPMKNWLNKSVGTMTNFLAEENMDDLSYDDVKGNVLKRMIAHINRAANRSKRFLGRPFYIALSVYAGCFGALICWHFYQSVW